MFENSVRGGQIFWHQLTMFKQILFRSFAISFLIGIIVTLFAARPQFTECDFNSALTFKKAEVTQWLYKNKLVLHSDIKSSIATIDAYDAKGLYAKNIRVHTILNHGKFKAAHSKVQNLIISMVSSTLGISCLGMVVIFSCWSIFGRKAKESRLLRGGRVLNAKEVGSILSKKKLSSSFKIGNMPLVKNAETKHILVTGATGSGKTNLFHTILPQIRSKNQSALVIDQTGEMIEHYYDPERGDVIFNPFDSRSYEWDFWQEIAELPRLNSVASSMFSNAKSHDMMWNNTSKQVFVDCVSYIKSKPNPSIAKLYELISSTPLPEASKKLQGYASSSLLNPAGDRTAMSIRSNTIAFINWLEYLPETGKKPKFTLKDWIPDTIKHNGQDNKTNGRWLFIAARPEERSLLRPLQSLMLDLAILSLQKLEPDHKRRFWIIADELASLKKLEILPQSLAEVRKYGGCIMTALQSLNQLNDIYGHNVASTMFGQFATKFMFRTSEPAIARMISEMFGSVEYKEQQQNTSYGAHEHRDGISYTEQERKKALITVDDLASLADLECFVELPEPTARLAKIKTPRVILLAKKQANVYKGTTHVDVKAKLYAADIADKNEHQILQIKIKEKNKTPLMASLLQEVEDEYNLAIPLVSERSDEQDREQEIIDKTRNADLSK